MDKQQTNLEQFLKDTEDMAIIHLVIPRAVATGQLVKNPDDTKNVHLLGVSVATEFQVMRLNTYFVPIERRLSWGWGPMK
jgi:hypothetical protein